MSPPPPRAGSAARDEILAAVRAAVRGAAEVTVPRDYRRAPADAGTAEVLQLFTGRLRDIGTRVHVSAADGVAAAVAQAFAGRGLRRVIVPPGLPADWLPPDGFDWLRDDPPLSQDTIAQADGVLTAAAVAVADSGTVVLDGGAGQGRRVLTLLPDAMCVVLRADQVVRELPAALARLDGRRPTTFISGPSATVDIELVRVQGVHGPRQLDVVLVQD